jgi:urea transport system ATP-binding protein
VLLVEQHVGFALRTASAYYILESGRITARGDGGSEAHDHVRSQLAV